jgi:hypothetical protein
MKILLGLLTSPGSNWQAKIQEIRELNLKEVAVFLTWLPIEQRKEFYKLLKTTGIASIPLVHLRTKDGVDTEPWELDFFVQNFGTKAFNVYPDNNGYAIIRNNPEYQPMIFVENLWGPELMKNFTSEYFEKNQTGGICLDFSHLETNRILFSEQYGQTIQMLKKYPIGCNHISGIRNNIFFRLLGSGRGISIHKTKKLSHFDYLKNFPRNYFSPIISLELKNSFREQLEIKRYIEGFIN